MEETKKNLLENTLTLYYECGENPEDLILGDEERLKELAGMWEQHQQALKLLVRVVNSLTIKHLVEKATPIEVVGLRHQICGAESIITQLEKYASISGRNDKNEKNNNTEAQQSETSVTPEDQATL